MVAKAPSATCVGASSRLGVSKRTCGGTNKRRQRGRLCRTPATLVVVPLQPSRLKEQPEKQIEKRRSNQPRRGRLRSMMIDDSTVVLEVVEKVFDLCTRGLQIPIK